MSMQNGQPQPNQQPEVTDPSTQIEMRRIAEKGEVPTDKQELIKYLTERIQQAEQALEDTDVLLEREKAKREKITQSLADRSAQLNNLLQLDKKSLPQKIRDRLQQILTEAITSKLNAQNQLQSSMKKNYEYKQSLSQLKQLEAEYSLEQQIITQKEDKTKQEISMLENSIGICEENIRQLEQSIRAKIAAKQNMQNKYLQLRVVVDRMNDVRNSLNRLFTNEQLFDEKMDLKERVIKRPVPVSKEASAENSPQPPKDKLQKLKPIERISEKRLDAVNNQEDFWGGQAKQLDRKPNPKQKLPSVKK